jgi:hypothetical protein
MAIMAREYYKDNSNYVVVQPRESPVFPAGTPATADDSLWQTKSPKNIGAPVVPFVRISLDPRRSRLARKEEPAPVNNSQSELGGGCFHVGSAEGDFDFSAFFPTT